MGTRLQVWAGAGVLLASLTTSSAVQAQEPSPAIVLTIARGRTIHVSLSGRTRVRRVGQPIDGTIAEPLYAYDRVVIPAGAHVQGRLARFIQPSTWQRVRAYWSGDFSPHRQIVVAFDVLQLPDGDTRRLDSLSTVSFARPRLATAPAITEEADRPGHRRFDVRRWAGAVISTAKQRVHDSIALVRAPDKVRRLEHAAMAGLPYHPQYLEAGTLFIAPISTPLAFGTALPGQAAAAGAKPEPSSILKARLLTPISSSQSRRGTPIEASLTEPVFTAGHQLVLPEGTRVTGEVTRARPARRFHRNGQLRFLIERVQVPGHTDTALLASLHGVQSSADTPLAVDEEGGTTITNQKSRFVAPALSILALRRSFRRGDDDDAAAADVPGQPPRRHVSGIGALIGFRFAGVILGRAAQPVGVAITVAGVARTVYTNILGRGRDISFPVDTPIQLQLAPAAVK